VIEKKDYYSILEVDVQTGPQEIRNAYRRLAFRYHPDRNGGDSTASEKMKAINEAYAVLSDPHKRKEYDILRQQYGSFASSRFRQGYSDEDIFRGSDINHIFEEMARAFGFSGFDEVFRSWYGAGYGGFASCSPGTFSKGFVYRGPFEASPPRSRFPLGGKIGKLARYLLKRLWGLEWPERGKDRYDVITLDPQQAQQGGEIAYFDRGKSKQLEVKVPPRIRDGQRIRLKGMGADGRGGAEPGDLYLKVRVKSSLWQKMRDFSKKVRRSVLTAS
jgi:DnaJ-class molecular chaperone